MTIKGAIVGMVLGIAGIAVLRQVAPETAQKLLGVTPPAK